MGGPNKLPVTKGGEKMLRKALDLPTSACRSSAGGRPDLGRASPSLSSCLPFTSSFAAPVVSLPHLLL